MVRVVIADDEFLVRQAVAAVLEDEADMEVVAACGGLLELEQILSKTDVDVVITDIRMPPSNTDEGIRFAARQRAERPDLGVVVLSQHDDPAYAMRLLDAGAGGRAYLLKERVGHPNELTAAVRAVDTGGSSIDPRVVERLVTARSRQAESPLRRLTPRERDVLAEMATGRNNPGIAEELHLSERAVLKHINSIFSKFGLSQEPATHKRVAAVLHYLSATASEGA